jgi:anti-anti-sigma factor
LLESGEGDVVVDISRVDSIDMTTLKLLAVANRAAERQGRRVVLRGASPGVRRLLHLAHLRSRIPVEPRSGSTSP